MANKKFIGKAKKQMERKGTVGAFTAYCGGRVTQACIDRAKNSDDPTLRRRAQFAENMRGIGSRKGREGIRKQREEMFLGGALEKVGGALTSDKFAGVASAAGGVGGSVGKTIGGVAKGAKLGAALGTVVPGLGNVVGAAIGGIAGGLGSIFKGRKAKKEAEEAEAKAEADEKKLKADMMRQAYKAQYDATIANMPKKAYGTMSTGVAKLGRRKKKGLEAQSNVDYQTYSGAEGKSMTRETAQKMWDTRSSADEKKLGSKMTQDSDGNYIVRTKTEVKAQDGGFVMMEDAFKREEAVEGKRRLPGGLELQLKNGAKKFVGNKHDEAGKGSDSGIILEESTKAKKGLEVEDGELEVKDDKGSYIVSNYIKNPDTGNTLAEDLEKELKGLDKKKDAKEIKKINKKYIDMNEKLKDEKEEPDSVKAIHGVRRAYMQAGGRNLKSFAEFKAAYPKFNDHESAYESYVTDMTSGDDEASAAAREKMQEGGRSVKTYDEFIKAYPKLLAGNQEELSAEDAYDRYLQDLIGEGETPSQKEARKQVAAVNKLNSEAGHSWAVKSLPEMEGTFEGTNLLEAAEKEANFAGEKPGDAPLPMTQRQVAEVVKPERKLIATRTSLDENMEKDAIPDFLSNIDDVEVPLEKAAKDEAEEQEEKGGKLGDFLGKAKDFLGNIPRGYGQGTMLQALGAAAYLKNRDDPMAPILAPSYINRIPPAEYKSFAPERAAATAAFNAQKTAIDTTIAGPAAIAARQAAAASQAANMSKIATADVRDRARINQQNANNELRVALANQKAYNTTTRANAAAKYAADLSKFENKYKALDKIGDTSAQALKDRRSAQSEALFASATQIGGAFDRAEERYGFNKLFPFLAQDKSVEGGLTAEDAGALLAGQGAEADTEEVQAEEQERRGGRRKKRYIRRKGAVRRRKIKKK